MKFLQHLKDSNHIQHFRVFEHEHEHQQQQQQQPKQKQQQQQQHQHQHQQQQQPQEEEKEEEEEEEILQKVQYFLSPLPLAFLIPAQSLHLQDRGYK